MADKQTFQQKFQLTLNRLEALSVRERAMLLLGVPLTLAALAEVLVNAPAQRLNVSARQQSEAQSKELVELTGVLAKLPEVQALPAASQLQLQRDEMKARIDAGERALQALGETTDWGSVVRAAVGGTPGLTLAQLRTLPAESLFSSVPATGAAAKPVSAAIAASAASKPAAPAVNVYRHRAELTIQGNFEPMLGYLQSLQRTPGELRWDRLQLNVANYPLATMQLGIYTLSTRSDTPFN